MFYYTIQQSLPFAWSASLFPCNRIIIIVKSFLRFFFNVRHFLKSLLNLLQYCFSFVLGVLVTKTCGIPNQGLKLHPLHWKEKSFFVILFLSLLFFLFRFSFLFCFGRQNLNHWTTREVPVLLGFESIILLFSFVSTGLFSLFFFCVLLGQTIFFLSFNFLSVVGL